MSIFPGSVWTNVTQISIQEPDKSVQLIYDFRVKRRLLGQESLLLILSGHGLACQQQFY